MSSEQNTDQSLGELVDRLLVRDADTHREAAAELAERGDERVVPHLVEVFIIDSIASDWEKFGFPEVLRDHSPPRYLELPEVSWPGSGDALRAITGEGFDSEYAWVEWESWYSQQEIEPLAGFEEWKLQLYRSYLPTVGCLLDTEPRAFDVQDVRWGNCGRSFLAALNEPDFLPADAVAADGNDGWKPDDLVFGFGVGGQAYAVPRWVIFPHEMLNVTLDGEAVSLTYCTLCNAPILYDREVGGETLTFGNSGMLISGNKVMFDEQTGSLWSQHRGIPLAGDHLDAGSELSIRAVTQTEWLSWRERNPETMVLDIDTGFDYDYSFYKEGLGIFRHYWKNEDVVQPGVRTVESGLPEKAEVYGVTGDDPDRIHVYPVKAVAERGPFGDEIDGREVVVMEDATGDVSVYEAPPMPVERDGDGLVDADGGRWTIDREALRSGGEERERVAGRHGLWFAFRSQYDDPVVVNGTR